MRPNNKKLIGVIEMYRRFFKENLLKDLKIIDVYENGHVLFFVV